jgi:hypothetical protein
MQQFVRVKQNNSVIPALVSDAGLLDLRSLISDITPDTLVNGVLTEVNTDALKPLSGEVQYLAPIHGVRQIPATGFNYKKHIQELKVPTPTEPEVFLKSMLSVTGPFDPIRRGARIQASSWIGKLSLQSSLVARHRISKSRMQLTTFSAMCVSTTSQIAQLKSTQSTNIISCARSLALHIVRSVLTSQLALSQ